MEQQLTIFDIFREMDASEEKKIGVYERCSIPGIQFQELTETMGKRHKDMNFKCVVHEKTRRKLFLISLEEHPERKKNKFSFFYQALDGYWGGNYGTDDIDMIKGSIARVSKEIIKEEEATSND